MKVNFSLRETCKYACECRRRRKRVEEGREAERKHQGGQTAMKSLKLPASEQIGLANWPNPQSSFLQSAGEGGEGGAAAKACPRVKWRLLEARRGGRFLASLPADLCGPNAEPPRSPGALSPRSSDAGPDAR